jgi:uncharacterized protein YggU (UPF0235/DUF167 family)
VIEVRVRPRARLDSVEVQDGRRLRVNVTAAPEGGKANEAVVPLLAKSLGIPKSTIRVVRGHRSTDKLLDVAGLSFDEVVARLGGGTEVPR